MPEPTISGANLQLSEIKRFANEVQDTVQSPLRDQTSCSDSEDMESELRIVDAPSPDMRTASDIDADQASSDNEEMSPQDLRIVRASSPLPLPLLKVSPKVSPRPSEPKQSSPDLKPPSEPSVGASRKRKSTTPTQDVRAKWLFSEAANRHPPPLSPAVNGRGRLEENGGVVSVGHSFLSTAPGSGAPTPSDSPGQPLQSSSAPASEPEAEIGVTASEDGRDDEPSNVVEDEEMAALTQKLGRFEEQFRQDMGGAMERFFSRVKTEVRGTVTAMQSRNLATLSAAAAAAAAASAHPPISTATPQNPLIPQLPDINGNPPFFNIKEVTKSVEQMMLAQCLPYRVMAAAAAANATNRLAPPPQLPYPPPISGPGAPTILNPLLPPPNPHMPLAFPMPSSLCASPSGTGAGDSDDPDGDSLPLNMSKKKRTKVTDNHLRSFGGLDMTGILPQALENMAVFNNITVTAPPVATTMTPTPSVSLTSSPLRGPGTSFTDLSSTTLTPVHLRKAKLMFFYTRYPNSNVLKVYFPDVKFNKHNTAQIVKWFSNFREFYYIQIEKFARQAIAEGVQEADEMTIVSECELIRTLNTHYNRNNQITVPMHFITVVEVTVREFFKALITHKDQDHSWKKPIYKVIARYDQPVPDDFKNSNWIDHLDS